MSTFIYSVRCSFVHNVHCIEEGTDFEDLEVNVLAIDGSFCVYHECETHVHVCAWRRVAEVPLRLYLEMKFVQPLAKTTSQVLIVMLCYQHCQFQRLQRVDGKNDMNTC
ncbi:hypothetical protein T4D_6645 [Trichinella pseudospiralis]|uniref:Uncharacterized protein n=1 Tax=Trichinella pseudospiralis TaxID=6337 RepID=A0A0V1F965_TRIPS|nr:hypothetical protein T4D_6645 [Trichinella pseudospiralis]